MRKKQHVNRFCNFRRQKSYHERCREGSKISRTDHRNAVHVECRNETDTINNRGNWNHLRIIQTETAIFQILHRLEKSLSHKEIALGAFLDIEGAFDNTSFIAITKPARECGLQETCCWWVRSMLNAHSYTLPSRAAV
jgi:hypothetical protein